MLPEIEGVFNPFLVTLSFTIASVAGFCALLIAERISIGESERARHAWLLSGAFAMGSGIWSMHFIGMLAFKLPIPVNYDPTLTAFSILPAFLGSGVALNFMKGATINVWRLNVAGLLMASGIGAMHFLGMAAMRSSAEMRHDPILVVGSIFIAYVFATLSLYGTLRLKKKMSRWRAQLSGSLVMGFSVCGMHYTAMASSSFYPGMGAETVATGLSASNLALVVTSLSCFVLGTAIIAGLVDRRLREVHGRMQWILDSIGEGIFGVDPNGFVTFVNSATSKMVGWQPNEIVGQLRHEMIHHSRADRSHYPAQECPIQAAWKDGSVHRIRDEVFWKKDGTSFPVEYVCTPVKAPNGDVVGAVVSFRDLSEQRVMEVQLVQAQKLESIGQLAAGIAHEINTPSQYVGDNLEFLQQAFSEVGLLLKSYRALHAAVDAGESSTELASEINTVAEKIDIEFLEEEIPRSLLQSREGISRVAKIVGAMKEFSHPGSVEKKLIDLNRAIESTATVARNEWKYVSELEMDFDENLPMVACLAGEFNQVILNIIVNAAHAIDEVRSENSIEKGTIRIRTQREGDNEVLIEISDTGAGIPEQIRTKLFDPFFTTKEFGKGTGQGLAIARSVVVDKHGGTLEVESEVGRGSVFRIHLPIGGNE